MADNNHRVLQVITIKLESNLYNINLVRDVKILQLRYLFAIHSFSIEFRPISRLTYLQARGLLMSFLLRELIFIFSRSLSRLEPFARAYRSWLRAELRDECRPYRPPSNRPWRYHPFNVYRYCSTYRIRIWRGFGRLIRLPVLDRQQFRIWKWYECIYEYFSSTKSALLFFRGCSIIRKLASGCPDGTGPKFLRTELEISSSMI